MSFNRMDWTPYLESIRRDSRYALSRECFTPLDVLDRRPETRPGTLFLLDLRVRTVPEAAPGAKERPEQKVERWDVLDGLRRHAIEHVLLIGRPGSGKSTALQRLLLEEAGRALSAADARIPVLLELRHYQTSTPDLIERALRTHGLFLDAQRLPEWLRQGRLLLLVDGINELPSDVARRELAAFRQEYRITTPMIFATRELAVGGDLEIGKRLEMEPLTEPQMQRFMRAYLGEDSDKLLRQLQGRLRELAEVPLLLWMLCSLFRETQERLPENLGLALRQFAALYDHQLKGDAPVSGESRRWWPRLLQRLAFKMLEGPEPTELYVAVARSQAEDWLTDYLREEQCDQPRSRAMAWLNDLVNHHLLQRSAGDRIEFRHQFIQEYYAAEYLLRCLPKLDDVALQHDYLNYLKWTEPFILLLGLMEERQQALRIVKLAETVDWSLAARLSGAVRPDWQAEAIRFIATTPQIPEWHRVELYGLTRSLDAVPLLDRALSYEDLLVRLHAVWALGEIGGKAAADLLYAALHDEADGMRLIAAKMLGSIGDTTTVNALRAVLHNGTAETRKAAVWALGEIGGEATVDLLRAALCDDTIAKVRQAAAMALGKIDGEVAIKLLHTALHDKAAKVRKAAVWALGETGGEATIDLLRAALRDDVAEIRRVAVWELKEIGSKAAVDLIHTALRDNAAKVRKAAVLALEEISGEVAVNSLHDDADEVRKAATFSPEEIDDAVVVDTQINALRNGNWNAALALKETGNVHLLVELAPNFRQDIQIAPAVYSVIKALQQRFKIYRADTFLPLSTEPKLPPAEKIMRTLRVVLASPSDVQPERDILPGVIEELNRGMGTLLDIDLKLYRWETDAYPGFHPEGPQGLIDGILRIDDCDILIGIFWKRFGKPTKSAGSGTEHEFLTAYEEWKKAQRPQIMMYFKEEPYSPKTREETEQWGKVLDFKANFPEEGLWWPFSETSAFKDLVRTHLSGWLRDNFKK